MLAILPNYPPNLDIILDITPYNLGSFNSYRAYIGFYFI